MNISNMKTFTGVEYLAIDVANTFGAHKPTGFKGDKATFEERIQWVQDHFSQLEKMVSQVDEDPILYKKAVLALKRACNGETVGHMVPLDACCSGIQIMSALTGCKKGARITGLVDPEQRMDAYKFITDTMNLILKQMGFESVEIPRKDAKDAIMPCTYGSKAKPEEYFSGKYLEAFYQACRQEAKGAFELLDTLRDTWESFALQHSWQLADGFVVQVKVMEKVTRRVHIEELFNYNMSIETKLNQGTYKGVSNVANVIHSIDGYLLREVIRRCNYNRKQVHKVVQIIQAHLESGAERTKLDDEELEYYFNLADKHGIVSIVIVPHITADNVAQLHKGYLTDLLALLLQMQEYEPFMVVTVHDAFASLPNHCNIVRHWYRELLAELADSETLQYIIQQITHDKGYKLAKHSHNISSYIRKSNYAVC